MNILQEQVTTNELQDALRRGTFPGTIVSTWWHHGCRTYLPGTVYVAKYKGFTAQYFSQDEFVKHGIGEPFRSFVSDFIERFGSY
jgi:hypothetical protein